MRVASLVVVISILSSAALAQYKADLPLLKGAMIVVDTYDSKTKTFAVFSARFPCEGYSYVVPEALAIAVSSLQLSQIKRDPKSLLGKQFGTTAELKTIFDEAVQRNHEGKSGTSALTKVCSN